MKKPRKANRGWFKSRDERRTKQSCQKGYAAALEAAIQRGWDAYAWFFRKVRGFYDHKREE